MGIMGKYATRKKFNYEFTGYKRFFKPAEFFELYGSQPMKLMALYINKKGNYGDEPVAVTEVGNVNLPKHLLETVVRICEDGEAVEAINAGKAGISIYSYMMEGKARYSATFVDM